MNSTDLQATDSQSTDLKAIVASLFESGSMDWQAIAPANPKSPIKGVKNLIAVASGKGGVGKSTTTVNLALALARLGARVGLLDADIYGPSIPTMLGIEPGTRPQMAGEQGFLPIEAHGIVINSMGLLVTDKTPMVWRGPMASGALQQILLQTRWPALDYLLIDMPPGTGDIHLTLAQKASLSGAVVVTTPQDIALLDAKKGIEMFNKVQVPLLGIVENMAAHICSKCGHQDPIFGEQGAQRIADAYQVPCLGQLPLDTGLRQAMDIGQPVVVSDSSGRVAQAYIAIAQSMAAQLWLAYNQTSDAPEILVIDD